MPTLTRRRFLFRTAAVAPLAWLPRPLAAFAPSQTTADPWAQAAAIIRQIPSRTFNGVERADVIESVRGLEFKNVRINGKFVLSPESADRAYA